MEFYKIGMGIATSAYSHLLITGIIFIVAAIFMLLFASKKVNYIFGYRTPSSMKSPERFYFAQQYSGRLMFFLGVLSLCFAIYGYEALPSLMDNKHYISIYILVMVVSLIVPTELAIRRKFHKKHD